MWVGEESMLPVLFMLGGIDGKVGGFILCVF
jgi:hypothetical protein